ncbi:probable Dol-P-Man:Man(7)GlcNAc(2)-PP-Dol alpha-1,6-mannosyltransferase isoform X2 [Harmonia axyridis]|uniref:probable Dol-P-Man:Man(7)GlcNAc(2)-PP-Dol alpha-1,6-mannosyltransferase isoform X2 n=1 Tax=Harmonia axyridis TaxID=115357 RepID=UPI001E279C9C|nr:probable Dol-P-Man:Man(7)GlcNAc(2)-PP-Dol alpha-1,6-mannosyltransferase isoform X2 [Harmonia axyridis]
MPLYKIIIFYVRGTLALCVLISFNILCKTLEKLFGKVWMQWFVAITVTQSHFMFYLSRPLPNIFALPLVLLALNSWLKNDGKNFILFSGAAIIIFRVELVLFLGILLLYDLYCKRITIKQLFQTGIPVGLGFLGLSVVIDSIFWNRPLWPEGEVLWFNTILNKSSDYGTSPFLWYFYSAIPRGMAASLLLLPIGLYLDDRVRKIVLPALLFVLLYSFLPHKELRFIIYVFPVLNIAVATACFRLWENRNKSFFQYLLSLGVAGHLCINVLFTLFLLCVSGTNYPGGTAISHLHRSARDELNVSVHISNLAAQTGVSRFTQINDNWIYSKKENLLPGCQDMYEFTHIIAEAKSKFSPNLKPYTFTHDVIDAIEAFHQVSFNYLTVPPVKIRTKPVLFILKRKSNFKEMLQMRHFYEDDDQKESLSEEKQTSSAILEKQLTSFEDNSGNSQEEKIATDDTASMELNVIESSENELKLNAEIVDKSLVEQFETVETPKKVKKDIGEKREMDKENISKYTKKLEDGLDQSTEEKNQIKKPKISQKKKPFVEDVIKEKKVDQMNGKTIEEENEVEDISWKAKTLSKSEIEDNEIYKKDLKEVEPKEVQTKIVETYDTTEEIDEEDILLRKASKSSHLHEKTVDISKEMEVKTQFSEDENVQIKIPKTLTREKLNFSLKKSNSFRSKPKNKVFSIEAEKSAENKQQVKQNLKKLIQKYRRKKFDDEEITTEHTNEGNTKIEKNKITEDENTVQKEEINKIQLQIMEIIENNPNIANKDLIKEKLQKTIIDELIKTIDEKVTEKTGKLMSARDNVKTKKLVEVIEKQKNAPSKIPAPVQNEDIETQDVEIDMNIEKSKKQIIVANLNKRDKIREAQEKIEDIMNIIDDIVDTIEIHSNE